MARAPMDLARLAGSGRGCILLLAARHEVADAEDICFIRFGRCHDAAASENDYPVADGEELLEILRDEEDAGSVLASPQQSAPGGDCALGIQAAGEIRSDHQAGEMGRLPDDDHALQVPPGQ